MDGHDSGPVLDAREVIQSLRVDPAARVERAIDRWGVPTVLLIALCVVFYLLYTGKLQAIQDAQANTNEALTDHVNEMKLDRTEWRFFLRALCVNSANSESERANCVPPSEAR